MVDFHSHVLPGIDDGADSMEEAVRLCEIAKESGTDKLIATPHLANLDETEDFIRLRDSRLDELRRELDKRSIELEIYPGTEVYVNDDVFYAPSLDSATINGSRYMLIEFEFRGLNINRLIKYVNEFFARGYRPIIAHPERYYYMQADYDIVNHLADIGVLFQINAPSLAGYMGPAAQELSYLMTANGLASFIGTDAHSVAHRPTNLGEMAQRFPSIVPERVYDDMLNKNPLAVLNNEEIERGEMYAIRPRRFF